MSEPTKLSTTGQGHRQSAATVLYERAKALRQEADGLEELAGTVDDILSKKADGALWRLVISQR